MWGGLNHRVGDIIYRLSDFVSEEERKRMAIYPADKGSITRETGPWDSLEQWRQQWYRPDISQLVELLPPELMKMIPSPYEPIENKSDK